MNAAPLAPGARSFVDTWLREEPEMELALGFEPSATRDLAACWGTLLHELVDTAVFAREPGVAQVKLAWWGEALARGAEADAAHPLVRALFAHAATAGVPATAWQALIRAAQELCAQDDAASDIAMALAQRRHVARAAVSIESRLFAPPPPDDGEAATQATAASLLLWQLRRLLRGRAAHVPLLPLQLCARHGLRGTPAPASGDPAARAALADLARALGDALPPTVAAARLRRCRIAFDRRLLAALAARPEPAHATLPRLRALWTAWRAARATHA